MPNSSLALQRAVRDALVADGMVTALLGGPHVHDHPPQGAGKPYLTVGDIETRDWSTQSSRGHEHRMTVRAWSAAEGRRQAQILIDEIDRVLDGAPLVLEEHRLVNLSVVFWTVQRSAGGDAYEGIVRLRAVTEKEGE
ncbi:MAG: DUF3168 domain-containing protein [Parvibaculaceae bacterium]